MKITFYSNYLNHHQIPFSNEMFALLGHNYTYVATEPMEQERKAMGWDFIESHPYELRSYENEISRQMAMKLSIESDIVIIGSAPEVFVKERLMQGKLTFRYSERLYKRGLWRAASPRGMYHRLNTFFKYVNKPLYMLCASAYTAGDLAILGSYLGRCYKWGYFPEFKTYDIEQLMALKSSKAVTILWAGRFLDWKHPEHALVVAQRLDKENIDVQFKMIGNGEEFDKIKNMAKNMGLRNPIKFLGTMSPIEVRKHMEEANMYLFTSDHNEGWGAVLNEAMNSGCAVIASHAIGSVPFLIKHGENGLVYKSGDIDALYDCVKILLMNKPLCEKLGKNAYRTLSETWNAKVAADRIVKLSEELLIYRKCSLFSEGPCSKAPLIQQFNKYDI